MRSAAEETAPVLDPQVFAPSEPPVVLDFRPTVRETLRRYALGFYPCFLGETASGPIGWRKYSHRGIQWLTNDRIHIGKKQKRDVFDERFEVRYDTAFDQVIAGCATPRSSDEATWITPGLRELYGELHRRGFAHSFECWHEGRLVGGSFGIQLGSMMTIESMFHTMDNASKAAYVRTLLHLRERGFTIVDLNNVTPVFERFGAETVPQWKFEQILKESLRMWPTFLAGEAVAARWPAGVMTEVSVVRALSGVRRRFATMTRKRAA
jgi:leucyl/phenylalanyl-tRNA--protein transferase